MLQISTHHLSHVSDPCAPFNFTLLSIFQNFSLSLSLSFHQTYLGQPWPNFHGCSLQPPNPIPPPPPVVYAGVASSLQKCRFLFSCSPKPSRGRASPCSHRLRVSATTSIQPTISLAGSVNSVSKPLLPNSPLSVIIFRKIKMSLENYILFFQYFDINCFVCLVFLCLFCIFCFVFGMVSPFTNESFSFILGYLELFVGIIFLCMIKNDKS